MKFKTEDELSKLKIDVELNKLDLALKSITREIPCKKPKLEKRETVILDKKYNIFEIDNFSKLLDKIKDEPFLYQDSVIRRWYDQKIHDLGMYLFLSLKETKIEPNKFDKTCDLYIKDTSFDLKTCNLPLFWNKESISKENMIALLNTPKGRHEFYSYQYNNSFRKGIIQNRLFVLYHYDFGGLSWRESREDIIQFEEKAQRFIDNALFDEIIIDGQKVKCGIIIISSSDKENLMMIPNDIQNYYCIA